MKEAKMLVEHLGAVGEDNFLLEKRDLGKGWKTLLNVRNGNVDSNRS